MVLVRLLDPVDLIDESDLIETRPAGYRLSVTGDQVDPLAVEERGREARGEPDRSRHRPLLRVAGDVARRAVPRRSTSTASGLVRGYSDVDAEVASLEAFWGGDLDDGIVTIVVLEA